MIALRLEQCVGVIKICFYFIIFVAWREGSGVVKNYNWLQYGEGGVRGPSGKSEISINKAKAISAELLV